MIVENVLDVKARAAAKLEARFHNGVVHRTGLDGQRYM